MTHKITTIFKWAFYLYPFPSWAPLTRAAWVKSACLSPGSLSILISEPDLAPGSDNTLAVSCSTDMKVKARRAFAHWGGNSQARNGSVQKVSEVLDCVIEAQVAVCRRGRRHGAAAIAITDTLLLFHSHSRPFASLDFPLVVFILPSCYHDAVSDSWQVLSCSQSPVPIQTSLIHLQ